MPSVLVESKSRLIFCSLRSQNKQVKRTITRGCGVAVNRADVVRSRRTRVFSRRRRSRQGHADAEGSAVLTEYSLLEAVLPRINLGGLYRLASQSEKEPALYRRQHAHHRNDIRPRHNGRHRGPVFVARRHLLRGGRSGDDARILVHTDNRDFPHTHGLHYIVFQRGHRARQVKLASQKAGRVRTAYLHFHILRDRARGVAGVRVSLQP